MAYAYVAFDPNGARITGTLEVPSEEAAERVLWRQNMTIIEIKRVGERPSLYQLFPTVFAPKTRDIIVFSRQLSTLLDAGIALLQSIRIMRDQVTNRVLRDILDQVIEDIQGGRSFSQALANHPSAFREVYVRMMDVGERTGRLDTVLHQMAVYLEKETETVRKIRGALAYPSFVLLLAIGVVILLFVVTLPSMITLFQGFQLELPLTTRILLAIVNFTSANRTALLIGPPAVLLGLYLASRTGQGKRLIDYGLLKIKFINKVIILGNLARWTRAVSFLIRAGLALPEIMAVTSVLIGNSILRQAMEHVRLELIRGRGLSGPLDADPIFPRLLVQMVRVGEETGTLETNLEYVAGFYDDELDRAISAMTGMIEPALIIFVGGIVGFVALSMIMPLYGLMSAFQ